MTLRTKNSSINLLSEINKHPFDSRIKFKEEGHIYWIDDDNTDLISATTFIHKFFNDFETDKIINNIINSKKHKNDKSYKYYNLTKEEIIKMWDDNKNQASEAGTLMHADIEYYYNGLEVNNKSDEFKQFLEFYKDHSHLKMFRTEWMIFSDLLKITGSIDAVFINEDGTLSLGDWKRSKEITFDSFDGQTYGKFPFENLPDCNFYHYSLQLNLYRIILEKFYGKKIKEMFLVVLHPNNKNNKYKKIEVEVMDKEANLLLDYRKNELLKLGYSSGLFSSLNLTYTIENYKKNENKIKKLENITQMEDIFEEKVPGKRLLGSKKVDKKTIANDDIFEEKVPGKRLLGSKNIVKPVSEKVDCEISETKSEPKKLISLEKIVPNEAYKSLSLKQKKAYKIIVSGKNLLLTGPGGCGKTLIIKIFNEIYKSRKTIGITSTTGTSAILIGGSTLHSFLGIGLGKDNAELLYIKIRNNPKIFKRWCELNTLIIDEISMLSPELFDKLEFLARKIRGVEEPFGGIQLILTGDFLQLPCVNSTNFCFNSKSWERCITEIVYLNEIFRQDDLVFQKCLNEIRIGELSDETKKILEGRVNIKLENENGILPTKIYSLNKDVSSENNKEMNKLLEKNNDLEFFQYDLEYKILGSSKIKYIEELIKKSCNAEQSLELCIGAQVMLLCNLDLENQLANGSRGIITGFQDDLPVVKFLNGNTHIIDYYNWILEDNGTPVLNIKQIPLKLAFAISVHKSQGLTIDYAIIDMKDIFEYSQAYVALSRVKSLEGLSLKNLNFKKIMADPKAVEFYKNML